MAVDYSPRITSEEIADRKRADELLAPCVFVIRVGDQVLGHVRLMMTGTQRAVLLARLGLSDDTEGEALLDDAWLRFAVPAIEREWSTGVLSFEDGKPHDRPLAADDEEELVRLVRAKHCEYQIAEGRDLYCSAATKKDPTAVGTRGLRTIAPTSRPACSKCELPDSDFACSHLVHPRVMAFQGFEGDERQLESVVCDLGNKGAEVPGGCRANGYGCWERIIEPSERQELEAPTALALNESCEFLDAVWELEFKRQLFKKSSLVGAAQLALPCRSRADLESRMSALGALLSAIDLPLDADSKDGTLERMKKAIAVQFVGRDVSRATAAIVALQKVTRVRVALQHPAVMTELPKAFATLGLSYVPSDWERTWGQLRGKTLEALTILREEIRSLGASAT